MGNINGFEHFAFTTYKQTTYLFKPNMCLQCNLQQFYLFFFAMFLSATWKKTEAESDDLVKPSEEMPVRDG